MPPRSVKEQSDQNGTVRGLKGAEEKEVRTGRLAGFGGGWGLLSPRGLAFLDELFDVFQVVARGGLDQAASIVLAGIGVNAFRRTKLHEFAVVHHRHHVGHELDHA